MKTRPTLRGIAITCALAALAACSGSDGGNKTAGQPPSSGAKLVPTPASMLVLKEEASCDAFKSYVSDSIAELILQIGLISCPSCVVRGAAGGIELAVPAVNDAASFDSFTETNNQEQGVDELDQIEADAAGNFYIVDGRHLVIANGLPPAELRELASIELVQSGYIDGIVLDPANKRLVAVVTDFSFYGIYDRLPSSILPPTRPSTELLFVDVADPTNPVVDRRLSIEGFKLGVRRIGNRVHVVSHSTPAIPVEILSDAQLSDLSEQLRAAVTASDAAAATLKQAIRDRVDVLVAATDATDYLPTITLHAEGQDTVVASATCSDIAVPDVKMTLALTAVTSVDSDGKNVDSLKLVNNSWNVYASQGNLYLTQTSGGWWFADLQRQQTAIYKIAIGPGMPSYEALGVVDGWAGSSFQLSEHKDHLRIATNRSEFDPQTNAWLRDNNLYVLRDDGVGTLRIVGSTLGFGENESIYGVRFLGDRGFVVTFRQIDPLFAFDLSIPEDPRLVGELEMPGVSTYIHPLDENHLLTIGFDGDNSRLNGNFRLQIFDVRNLDDPRLVHSYVPTFGAEGFGWTQATFDHLAFNYFADAGTLTVPVQYYASNWDEHFSGFIAFSVDVDSGFAELGRLDHSDLARQTYCDAADPTAPARCDTGIYLQAAQPRRAVSALFDGSVYIYTLSNVGMKVSDADKFSDPVAVLPLPYGNDYPWVIAY